MTNIVVGDVTFYEYIVPSGPSGDHVWRTTTPTLPPLYQSTITQKAVLNGTKTNVNVSFDVRVPVVISSDAVSSCCPDPQSLQGTVIASARFTALQNIPLSATQLALAYDALIAALTAQRSRALQGMT